MKAFVVVFAGLVLAVIAGFVLWNFRTPRPLSPRPLFYDVQGENDMGAPMWRPNRLMLDRRGNYAFVDRPSNLFVLMVTGHPQLKDVRYPLDDPAGATLLSGTPFAKHIEPVQNMLVVVAPTGDEHRFCLGPGDAARWYAKLALIDQDPQANLPLSIADFYNGEDKNAVEQLLRDRQEK